MTASSDRPAASLDDALARAITEATGARFEPVGRRSVAGGCINRAECVIGRDARSYFVKLNGPGARAMFEAERAGLHEIAAGPGPRVPTPIAVGTTSSEAFLVLEFVELGPATERSGERLGRELAAQHRRSAARFGWSRDNTIGATPQANAPSSDWVDFLRGRRLAPQFRLAVEHGYGAELAAHERLLADLDRFFAGYRPAPSLLHGDLWGGNQAADERGRPVVFDPAVYYGDREADLAMTELFGGLPGSFAGAYREAWPLDEGYRVRRTLYNLYHVLNHLNLFGASYLGEARRMLAGLVAEC